MDGARSQASQRLLSFDARAAVWVARSGWEGVFYCSRPRGWPPRLARSGACEVSERARSPCWSWGRFASVEMHGKRGELREGTACQRWRWLGRGWTGNGRPMHRSGSHPVRGQTIMVATATLPRGRSARRWLAEAEPRR
jgi:hypothetical protein